MPLEINTTNAQIGMEITNAKVDIQQPQADVNMKTKHAQVNIKSENSKIHIDQSVCFSESGLKDVFELIKSSANLGKQRASQAIARISSEGDQLMRIENGGNPIISQAIRNAFEADNKDYNIGLTPKSRPKISATDPKLNIDFQKGEVNIDVNVNKPIINYQPGKVNIYLNQKDSINIEYVDVKG
ncbi:hypothetical protein IZY60_05475 [Lutibacter sp. B2]|nr:hypothetical protein [Lutibacter sp. B2]